MRFKGKVAVITGGANGIGQATALLMAREGAKVAIVDIDPTGLEVVAKTIRAQGGEAVSIEGDVLDEQTVRSAVQQVLNRFGRIDILVNNVGGSTVIANRNAALEGLTQEEWERTISFNLRGTFLCTRAVVHQMKQQGYGRIVNISSIIARGDLRANNAAYVTAKAGIRALTRRLAIELGPFGITCNAAAPSITLTQRIRRVTSEGAANGTQMKMKDIPLGRMATPEDQANVIAFLASDDAAFVSGQTIEVTGGQ